MPRYLVLQAALFALLFSTIACSPRGDTPTAAPPPPRRQVSLPATNPDPPPVQPAPERTLPEPVLQPVPPPVIAPTPPDAPAMIPPPIVPHEEPPPTPSADPLADPPAAPPQRRTGTETRSTAELMTRLEPLLPVARAHWEKARLLHETEDFLPPAPWYLDSPCANEEERFARAYEPDLNPFQMTIDGVQLARPFCVPTTGNSSANPSESILYYRQRGIGETLYRVKYVLKLRRVHLVSHRIAGMHTILIDESDRIVERRDTEWRLPQTFFERLISNFQRGPRPIVRTSIAAMDGHGVAYMRVVHYSADGVTPESQELSFTTTDPRFGISTRTEGPGLRTSIERYRIYPQVAWREKLVLLSPLEAGLQAFRLPEGNLTSQVLPVLDATLALGTGSTVTCVEGRETEDNDAVLVYRDENASAQGCAVAAR